MPSRKPRQRFHDIVDNIDSILRYAAGLDEAAFMANDLVVDAVERCLSRISEAAVKLGDDTATLAPGPPWDKIRGIGNRLRHEYDVIKRVDLWQIIEIHLVPLREASTKAIARIEQGQAD